MVLLGLFLCMIPPVLAKPQNKALSTRRSAPTAKKGAVPTELSAEKRLQLALELMHQKKWQQAVQTIGNLTGTTTSTPTIGRLWFLRATLAEKLADTPT